MWTERSRGFKSSFKRFSALTLVVGPLISAACGGVPVRCDDQGILSGRVPLEYSPTPRVLTTRLYESGGGNHTYTVAVEPNVLPGVGAEIRKTTVSASILVGTLFQKTGGSTAHIEQLLSSGRNTLVYQGAIVDSTPFNFAKCNVLKTEIVNRRFSQTSLNGEPLGIRIVLPSELTR